MTKSHKGQHWIPKSYLAAWVDPDVPPTYEPYVNIISKDGRQLTRRSPANIFTETDMYTIKLPDGQRDLRLEHGLSELESAFAATRKEFLARRRPLPIVRYAKLMAFVAAMQARTRSMRDHHRKWWTKLKEMMEQAEEQIRHFTPEQRRNAAAIMPPRSDREGMTLDDVREVATNTMQHIFPSIVQTVAPALLRMQSVVLCTESDPGFITSDSPVVWFDPEAYKRPPLFRTPGLVCPKLEITMPLSPRQCLLVVHGPTSFAYLDVEGRTVSEMNRRTSGYCDEEFVVRRAYVEPYWLDPGQMPADAWEALHGDEKDAEAA